MKPAPLLPRFASLAIVILTLALSAAHSRAQSCETAGDIDQGVRSSITAAGQRFFDMAAKGDVASLHQSAIPRLAAAFADVEDTVKNHQPDLAGAQASVKSLFLLDAAGEAPIPHAEFFCGVFGKNGQTANSAAFYLDNLPPAKYAVVLVEATSPKGRTMFSEILQQAGTDWKLGDLYIKSAQVAGHDSDWFLQRAREFKSKGQTHNAWLFYLQARSLVSPLVFMSTMATEKLYDESQSMQPSDFPANGKTTDLNVGNVTYKLTDAFPDGVGNDVDLVVKYQTTDASNSNRAYADNVAVIKAMVTKYPELRDAFAAVVGRAVDPSGRDYGTLLAMKDIK